MNIGKTIKSMYQRENANSIVITYTDGSKTEIIPEIKPEHPEAHKVEESDLVIITVESTLEPVKAAWNMLKRYEDEYQDAVTIQEKLNAAHEITAWLENLKEMTDE